MYLILNMFCWNPHDCLAARPQGELMYLLFNPNIIALFSIRLGSFGVSHHQKPLLFTIWQMMQAKRQTEVVMNFKQSYW